MSGQDGRKWARNERRRIPFSLDFYGSLEPKLGRARRIEKEEAVAEE
jgi:hypothetical protein